MLAFCSAAIADGNPQAGKGQANETPQKADGEPGVMAGKVVLRADAKPVDNDHLDQAHAIQELENLGCSVYPYEGAPAYAVTGVGFRWGSNFWDENIPLLQAFPNLTTIDFRHTKICGTRIWNAGLKKLANLKKLTTLNFSTTGIGDDALKEIGRLKGLTGLILSKTQITDAGLKELTDLTDLAELNVSDTGITGAGLAKLKTLKKLTTLSACRTCLTDDDVMGISELKNLRSIVLSRYQVTDGALRRLRASAPNLHVVRRDE
jgi:internalin A